MKKVKSILAAALCAAAAFPSDAKPASKSGSFTKSNDGEWTTTVTVKKGKEYTFWVVPNTEDMSVSLSVEGAYTYKEDGETWEDSVWPSEGTSYNGAEYVLLTADDWEYVADSVSSVKFTVQVSGWWDEEVAANNKFTLYYEEGRASYPGDVDDEPVVVDPTGTASNPKSMAFAESLKKDKCTPAEDGDGTYYMKTASTLAKGRRYLIGVEDAGPLKIFASGNAQDLAENDESGVVKPYYGWDCEAYSITPAENTSFTFQAEGYDTFTLWYQVLPALTPEKHESAPIGAGETSEPFNPGYMCDPEGAGYDQVIDRQLFAVTNCEKSCSYVFETQGADAALIMRVYDKTGKVLAENFRTSGEEGEASDVRCVWTAPANYAAKGNFIYVGVCQNLESEDEEPYAGETTLTVRKTTPETRMENLAAAPDATDESPVMCPGAAASSEAVLNDTVWTNTYAIAARAGVTYRVKADSADETGLALAARVYTLSGAKATLLTAAKEGLAGSIDPADEGWLSFTASAHGTVYIDTFVADGSWGSGRGLDYGPYKVFATAAGEGLGTLTVDMKGAPEDQMAWQIIKKDGKAPSPKEPFYPAGSSVILPKGEYAIAAQAVKGFAAPDKNGFAAVKIDGGEATEEYKYTDTFDPLDDSPDAKAKHPSLNKAYAPAKLAPAAAKPAVAERSLWSDDAADWYTVAAAAGSYYRFAFASRTGDARLAVFGPDNWTDECEYTVLEDPDEAVQICAARKGTYYIRVAHADGAAAVDSSYTLEAAMATPGVVKFAKTAIPVKDSAAYADVSVSRTGKDGTVRVKFRTEGDQTDASNAYYYPTNGILQWAAGDTKAKTVRVRLVPQDAWHSGKTVKVVLEKIDAGAEDFDKETEYVAAFESDKTTGAPIDTATITITASAKQTPGTVQVADCDTPKKPVLSVIAGESIAIPFERVSGSDGIAGVKLETVKGTANKTGESDFAPAAETFVWEDGEDGMKEFEVQTKAPEGDWTAVKTFTVKATALSGKTAGGETYAKPSIAAPSVTVNIVNAKMADTLANYAKGVTAASHGYALKEGKAGSWVVVPGGTFYAPAKGDLTFTFSTTGVFTYTVDGETQEFTATAKNKTLAVKGASSFSIDGYEPDGMPVVLRQGVIYEEFLPFEGTVKAANLPAGLKLVQDKSTKEWYVTGVPSKAGIFQTVYTATVGRESETKTYCYTVEASGSSVGTFTGLARTYDTTNRLPGVASVAFTAAATGKLSAKAMIAGKTYTFTADGYSDAYGTPGDEDDPPFMEAELTCVQKAGTGKDAVVLTNTLLVTLCDLPETSEAAWTAENYMEIRMAALPDAKGSGYQEDVWYEGRLCRDNSKAAAWQAAAGKFAGYYTIALVSLEASNGEPRGNGYLALTLDAKGKAKIAGALPDGTKYSAASVAASFIDWGGETILAFPVYACKSPFVAAGWLALKPGDDGTPVATWALGETIYMANDDPASTRDGIDGYGLELYPAGGWYDTVANLQRAYLESAFTVELADAGDVLEELAQTLPEGYAFAAQPSGEGLSLAGNTISAGKQTLAKDAAKKLNVWEDSVNAANLKPAFKRATGEFTGSFDLWYEGENAKGALEQKSMAGIKFFAIAVPNREDNGLLDDDVWATGFYIVPQTFSETVETTVGGRTTVKTVQRKYNGSYRFDVKAVDAPVEWTDAPAD